MPLFTSYGLKEAGAKYIENPVIISKSKSLWVPKRVDLRLREIPQVGVIFPSRNLATELVMAIYKGRLKFNEKTYKTLPRHSYIHEMRVAE